jgi:hypothetical protein
MHSKEKREEMTMYDTLNVKTHPFAKIAYK